MSQSNKLLLCHLPLLLLASAAAAEAHHRISGNQFRWPRCVPELAHTMNGQPLGTTVHAAQGGTVDVDVAVDGGLIANTYKARHGVARSAGHNGMIDVPVGPAVGPRPYDWKEHAVLVVRYGVARPAQPRGMIRVLAVPEGLEAESHAYDRPDHAVLLMRYSLALSVGRSGMNVVSVLEVAEEDGPFAYHREHAVHLTRDGTQRSAGLSGRMAMSLPAGSEAESFAYRREHDDRRKRSTFEQADTGLASVPLVWIGQIPRPTIRAVQGAAADVTVKNFSLTVVTEHVAIHWHGIRQIGTPWADGTEGVAQCSIPPGDTFTYRFVVDQPGAYTRHAHHGVQRSPGLNLNGTTFVAVPAGQAEPFAYGREHTDVHLAREDTRRTAGRDNGMTAVLLQGRADAETLACDCDHPVVPLDEWWNWHAQAVAGVAAVPSVLVGEPQLSLSYSVRASFNCCLLASRIRDATRPDCSSAAPFTVAAGKTYHIVTSSGLLFDRNVHLSTASLIALIMVVQVALDDQRRKNGGGRDAAVAMVLLILLLVIASLPNAAMAARPLHGGGGVHDQTTAGLVAAEPSGLMPESKAAAGSACTNDPNTQDPHRCVHH